MRCYIESKFYDYQQPFYFQIYKVIKQASLQGSNGHEVLDSSDDVHQYGWSAKEIFSASAKTLKNYTPNTSDTTH